MSPVTANKGTPPKVEDSAFNKTASNTTALATTLEPDYYQTKLASAEGKAISADDLCELNEQETTTFKSANS